MNSEEKVYETLSLGIYHRFREEDIQEKRKRKKAGILPSAENPLLFETFVANVMENVLGGRAKVTPSPGDFGVDIVHTLPNRDIYLAQVKCYKPENNIDYDPLVVLQSNIVTRKAQGAFFVSTNNYSPQAESFAAEQGIELINGYDLSQYWLGVKMGWIDTHSKGLMDHLLNGRDSMNERFSKHFQ
ncbi:restriction endonuclease [Sporosarcina sp. FSL K6-1508]|uniref:restriction endonuclease n=1 Tax=Sporosarcina sp. FSL K6-1508 TaxID=2921553 RepID=UPI0030FC13A3